MVTISRTPTFALAALPCSRARLAGLFAAGVLAAGCTQVEKLEDDGGSGNAGIPTEVQRAFDESCAISSCHDTAARQGGLDLSATAAPGIIGGQSSQSDLPLVELGNVQGSYLALKMLPNPPAGSQMPIGIPPGVDNPTNIAIILGWIAGAPLPGGGGGEGGSTTEAPVESTGEPEVKLCGLEDVAPSEPNPFDIGMNAGQIPPDVGEALSNNCGCHEVDPMAVTEAGAFPYTGIVRFSTIAEIQAEYSLDEGMSDPYRTGVARVLERVESEQPNRMPPPYYCDLGDGSVITDADRQLLIDWLMAGAPDAPSWMP